MIDIYSCNKHRFVCELWLPMVKKSTKHFFPRKRANFGMSLFTLTADNNFEEVAYFSDRTLIEKRKTVVWSYASVKCWRLETELPESTIVGLARYENSVSDDTAFTIKEKFPFNIINLDFSSQDPENEEKRIEKELDSLERTISIQNETNGDFILLFTTVLNGYSLNFNEICATSDSIRFNGWTRLDDGTHTTYSLIQDNEKKIEILEYIFKRIAEKYRYCCECSIMTLKIDDFKMAISIAGLLKREVS
jgi:hypothetical protein